VRLTLADLQGQFGVGLKDAANRLGICPTTLKRACRWALAVCWRESLPRRLECSSSSETGSSSSSSSSSSNDRDTSCHLSHPAPLPAIEYFLPACAALRCPAAHCC
jgi:hypothetical protein